MSEPNQPLFLTGPEGKLETRMIFVKDRSGILANFLYNQPKLEGVYVLGQKSHERWGAQKELLSTRIKKYYWLLRY